MTEFDKKDMDIANAIYSGDLEALKNEEELNFAKNKFNPKLHERKRLRTFRSLFALSAIRNRISHALARCTISGRRKQEIIMTMKTIYG